jgi:hypothetical protein
LRAGRRCNGKIRTVRKDGWINAGEKMNINFQKRQTKEDIRSATGNRAVKRSVERCAVVERKWNYELMKSKSDGFEGQWLSTRRSAGNA